MAYNNKNNLFFIYFVQDYYLKMKKIGLPNTRIIENIGQIYPIGNSTFYDYLGINVKKEIKIHDLDINKIIKYSENAIKNISED